MENEKSRVTARSVISYIISTLILVLLAYGVFHIVKHNKRAGQMTLLESQAMDMSAMKAPTGSVPVAIETVGGAGFEASITYAGSVVPLTEQDIIPRVQGQISFMPFYAGDRVRKNELLARLDSPDLANRTQAAAADAYAAQATAAAAADETAQMEKMTGVARAELDAALADLEYRKSELSRMQELYDSGAISRSELEQEKSMEGVARATVSQKRAGVQAAENSAEAAALRRKAMLRMADAGRKRTAVESSIQNYLELRSPVNGVVTQRQISPGAVVSPGTAILRVADISKVRLQAAVSEADAAQVTIGNKVQVTSPRRPGKTFDAAVTSVFPSTDTTTRTVIIEAIFDNRDEIFLPGDFVNMNISTAGADTTISVPERAIIYWGESGKPAVWTAMSSSGMKQIYTCTMHPEVQSEKPGTCPKCGMTLVPKSANAALTAHLVNVVTGAKGGGRVQILEGLRPGDMVVTDGGGDLSEGDSLFKTEWGPNGPAKLPPAPGSQTPSGSKSSPENMNNMKDMPNMPGMKM